MLTQNQLAILMKTYHAAKIAADKAKDLGEQIKAEARERGVAKLEAGGYVATIKDVTSITLNSKRLKADMPELWDTYSKTRTTTRLYFK